MVASQDCEESIPRPSLSFSEFASHLCIPWLEDTSPEFLSLGSHGVLLVGMSMSKFPLFYKDTNHIRLGAVGSQSQEFHK